jgi:HAD superfamily hydrolase (TIGR01509 family)
LAQGDTPSPFTLLCVDAMFTIFKPRRGGRKAMICKTYWKLGGLHRRVNNRMIWEAIMRERVRFRELKGDEDYWLHVNLAVFRSLEAAPDRHKSDYQAAQDLHRRITSDISAYEPDVRIIRLIRQLREQNLRVVIGSNQGEASLRKLVRAHKIEELFDAIYTSESLQTRKPYPDFWEKILELEGKTVSETIHVGNSPNSDIGAARLGIRTLLWDPGGGIRGAMASKKDFRLAHPDVDEKEFFRLLHGGLVTPFTTHQQALEALCPTPPPST